MKNFYYLLALIITIPFSVKSMRAPSQLEQKPVTILRKVENLSGDYTRPVSIRVFRPSTQRYVIDTAYPSLKKTFVYNIPLMINDLVTVKTQNVTLLNKFIDKDISKDIDVFVFRDSASIAESDYQPEPVPQMTAIPYPLE